MRTFRLSSHCESWHAVLTIKLFKKNLYTCIPDLFSYRSPPCATVPYRGRTNHDCPSALTRGVIVAFAGGLGYTLRP